MPNPKPTFEKIYVEMYCKNCNHFKFNAPNKKEVCMLPAQIQNACMIDAMDTTNEGPGFMYQKR